MNGGIAEGDAVERDSAPKLSERWWYDDLHGKRIKSPNAQTQRPVWARQVGIAKVGVLAQNGSLQCPCSASSWLGIVLDLARRIPVKHSPALRPLVKRGALLAAKPSKIGDGHCTRSEQLLRRRRMGVLLGDSSGKQFPALVTHNVRKVLTHVAAERQN